MYAFGPLPRQKRSGRIIGTHQKIDRVARRQLAPYLASAESFPVINQILHFEGSRGPDGIKLKSPGRDEPWHFINPKLLRPDDQLLVAIAAHSANLSQALAKNDSIRAGFEAAWLAHAITDGLTPAHHEPLDAQVKDLRHTDARQHKFRSRVIMTGHGSTKQFVKNNWQYWGAKGVMTSHTLFEAGVATTIKPLTFAEPIVLPEHIAQLGARGFKAMYIDMIGEIAALDMYEQFKQHGWTRTLARQTSRQLLPTIIKAVQLAWYDAYRAAEIAGNA